MGKIEHEPRKSDGREQGSALYGGQEHVTGSKLKGFLMELQNNVTKCILTCEMKQLPGVHTDIIKT